MATIQERLRNLQFCSSRLADYAQALEEAATHIDALEKRVKELEGALDDTHRLAREIDVALSGEANAANQASLCDLVALARDHRKIVIEECARVADERAAICADAVAKIKAGELYKETAATSVMTENCARLEAVHIAELIRDLNGGAKP